MTERLDMARRLLAWYDVHRRQLPWRALPGTDANPYHVWLSEIMLQQTTVAAVQPYFLTFLDRWPEVDRLAAASLDDVLHAWQGLGYYARARNLHKCARVIVAEHGGCFPDQENALGKLPGIGPYTAAAIAAIAFGREAVVVDGNVERVMARMFAVRTPVPKAKPRLRELAASLTPAQRPGDYAQAVMDLGATICVPGVPKCAICPWCEACCARRAGSASELPLKAAKPVRPLRRCVAFLLMRPDGAILLRRRPERGLLGGLMEVPSSEWCSGEWSLQGALAAAPVAAQWQHLSGIVRHVFTHFRLELSVVTACVDDHGDLAGTWCRPEHFADQALPTVMKKVLRHGLAAMESGPHTSTPPGEAGRRDGELEV